MVFCVNLSLRVPVHHWKLLRVTCSCTFKPPLLSKSDPYLNLSAVTAPGGVRINDGSSFVPSLSPSFSVSKAVHQPESTLCLLVFSSVIGSSNEVLGGFPTRSSATSGGGVGEPDSDPSELRWIAVCGLANWFPLPYFCGYLPDFNFRNFILELLNQNGSFSSSAREYEHSVPEQESEGLEAPECGSDTRSGLTFRWSLLVQEPMTLYSAVDLLVMWYWNMSYLPGASPFSLKTTGVPALPASRAQGEKNFSDATGGQSVKNTSVCVWRWTQELTLPNDAAHTRKTTLVSTNFDFSFYLSVSLPLFVVFRVAKRSNQAAEPGEEEIILQLTSGGSAALCKWNLCTISQRNGARRESRNAGRRQEGRERERL